MTRKSIGKGKNYGSKKRGSIGGTLSNTTVNSTIRSVEKTHRQYSKRLLDTIIDEELNNNPDQIDDKLGAN